jgi:alpha-L-fucosidase
MAAALAAEPKAYEPTWESLDSRPIPQWYDQAKFGIFIHWGVYSVPAWAPEDKYAEWYWYQMQDREGATWNFHKRTYGEEFQYQDFAPMFKAELYDPAQWADLFKRAGAKYVVLTSKHHDGFCLWPSEESWNWNSVDIGPHRDLLGDLTEAVRATGLKMGLYYSLYEWFNPTYKNNVERYVDEHMWGQFKDVVNRYKPSIIFSDGEWDHPHEVWRSRELLTWLFNESPVKENVVIDDRWGKRTRGRHGGYYTTEYGKYHQLKATRDPRERHKWEECRGIGKSFGYNRNEEAEDYATADELITLLVDTVAKGGNLLLDVGPTADGRIPAIQEQRLLQMGAWLKVNGEAIYGTRPWRRASDGKHVRYTVKDDVVYAICLEWPGETLSLSVPQADGEVSAKMLGVDAEVACEMRDGALVLEVPPLNVEQVPCQHAYVFALTGVK